MWFLRWGMISFLGFIAFLVSRSDLGIGFLLGAYVTLSGLFVGFFSPLLSQNHPAVRDAVALSAFQSTITFVGVTSLFSYLSTRNLIHLSRVAGLFGQLVSFSILISAALGNDVSWKTKLFDNPSLEASIVVLSVPFMLKCFKFPTSILLYLTSVLSVVLCKAVAPIVALVFVTAVILRKTLFCWLALPALCLMPFLLNLDDSGRFSKWMMALHHYLDASFLTWVFGYGTGTMKILLPVWENSSWMFLHNDWLQILLEQGLVGFGLSLMAFVTALDGAKKNTTVLSAVVGYGVLMCLNPMLHFPIHAAFGALIFFLAYRNLGGRFE